MKKLFIILIVYLSANPIIFAQLRVLSSGPIQGGLTNGAIKIEGLNSKTLDIGPKNYQFAHFYTNTSLGFYYNSNICVNGYIKSHNRDLVLRVGTTDALIIDDATSYVGIGYGESGPSYKLDVQGDIATWGTLQISSDSRLKKDVKNLGKEKVKKLYHLEAKTYYKVRKDSIPLSDTTSIIVPKDTATHIGFIAQELQLIYPELVSENNEGYLSINYISLIPVLVEAIKEQKSEIDELKKQFKDKNSLKSADANNETLETISSSKALLSQNQPNPFYDNTTIGYFLPSTIQKASLYIYNMQGKQIKNIPINSRGESIVTIYGSELKAGMYLYTLIADNKEVDTKRMILTE